MSTVLDTPVSFRATSDRLVFAFLFGILATSMFFWFFPEADLVASRLFFSPGDGFTLSKDPVLRWLRSSSDWVLGGIVGMLAARILWCAVQSSLASPQARKPVWLLAGLALGPGLIVNAILKELWGRPRPHQVDAFGGDAVYQKVWVISDWCSGNCSFVSGEASASAWLVAAAIVSPKPIRRAATAMAVFYAGSLSLNRVAFGGHFLSDVILAWLICGLVFALLYRVLPARAHSFRSRGGRISTRASDQ
ncbi:MAG: phosphoesterase [Rhizobiales bacterium]|nr:phosphoesterase [Hyphomicrobiales bacterium]MBA67963.1 phosphoesterase [Hyphomicrobiales bacterium]